MTFHDESPNKEISAAAPAEAAPASQETAAASAEAAAVPQENAASPDAAAAAPETAPVPAEAVPAAADSAKTAPAPAAAAKKPARRKKIKPERVKKLRKATRRILERNEENDIRYRGPLSYRHFRIFAWICLALSQVVVLMHLDQTIEPAYAYVYDLPIRILEPISSLALPFLLIANFATILEGQERYERQLLRYGGLSIAVIALYLVFYHRYLLGSIGLLLQDASLAPEAAAKLSALMFPEGYLNFNIFIDLFLCSLFMFLLNYRPKQHFQGKKVLFLRLAALLPVSYEIASIVLRILAASGRIVLPIWSYAFLTTKPPVTFLVFIVLAFYVKKRERIYRKNEKTHDAFLAHMKTNYNSLRFSLFTSRIFFLAGILDLILLFLLPLFLFLIGGSQSSDYTELMTPMISSGFGGSIMLIPMIPFMLLFSYTRTYKNRVFDALLPFGGVALILAVYIEGTYQALSMASGYLPPEFSDLLKTLLFTMP